MDQLEILIRFAAAIGLGLFLGLERERIRSTEGKFAGVRTFVLIAVAGATAGYVDLQHGLTWLGIAIAAATFALVVVSYAVTAARGEIGGTTELASLLTFLLGALCARGELLLAAVLTVVTALVLSLKGWLHALAARIANADVEAALKFAIITVIVLPLVPNQNFGPPPLDVINPYKIWLMVVLISGLNFVAYILVKVVGAEHGIGLTGLLGGLVSSTAVTLGFSQRSRQQGQAAAALALGILLAWTVMFVRVLIMTAIVNRPLALALLPELALVGGASLVACALYWRRRKEAHGSVASGENPFELSEALKFGLLFGVVTVASKACQVWLGDTGLYVAGAVAGLTDVDAITLSMAQFASEKPENLTPAARTVVIAALSNTLVKTGMALAMGSVALRARLLPAAVAICAAGGVGVWWFG
jgi:uncharacterized membrane protein (DUF4010 family)